MNPEIIEMAAKEIIELADEIFSLHNIDAQCLGVHLGLCPSQPRSVRMYDVAREILPDAEAESFKMRVDYTKHYDPRFMQ